jgi:hypothetical protein
VRAQLVTVQQELRVPNKVEAVLVEVQYCWSVQIVHLEQTFLQPLDLQVIRVGANLGVMVEMEELPYTTLRL